MLAEQLHKVVEGEEGVGLDEVGVDGLVCDIQASLDLVLLVEFVSKARVNSPEHVQIVAQAFQVRQLWLLSICCAGAKSLLRLYKLGNTFQKIDTCLVFILRLRIVYQFQQ